LTENELVSAFLLSITGGQRTPNFNFQHLTLSACTHRLGKHTLEQAALPSIIHFFILLRALAFAFCNLQLRGIVLTLCQAFQSKCVAFPIIFSARRPFLFLLEDLCLFLFFLHYCAA
jgi:hypothetical protein